MLRRSAALVTLVASATAAHAEGPAVGGKLPRTIGRAGVVTASDDGAGALLANPAGMARRDGARIQLGLAFRWRSRDYEPRSGSGTICDLAQQLSDSASAAEKCERAKSTCQTANETCCSCQ